MGSIANFQKRRAAERAKQGQQDSAKQAVQQAAEIAPENEALALLAALLGCEQSNAVAQAKKICEDAEANGLSIVIGFDPAEGTDQTAMATIHGDGGNCAERINQATADQVADSANQVNDAAATVEDAAAQVSGAADQVSGAASELEDTSGQLADTAQAIGDATAELKEATAELKKPSAGRKSSPGAKAGKQNVNSKK